MKHRKAAVEALMKAIEEFEQIPQSQNFVIEDRQAGLAIYLLEHFNISKKKPRVATVTEADVAKQ